MIDSARPILSAREVDYFQTLTTPLSVCTPLGPRTRRVRTGISSETREHGKLANAHLLGDDDDSANTHEAARAVYRCHPQTGGSFVALAWRLTTPHACLSCEPKQATRCYERAVLASSMLSCYHVPMCKALLHICLHVHTNARTRKPLTRDSSVPDQFDNSDDLEINTIQQCSCVLPAPSAASSRGRFRSTDRAARSATESWCFVRLPGPQTYDNKDPYYA
jgi:hypothetical protein